MLRTTLLTVLISPLAWSAPEPCLKGNCPSAYRLHNVSRIIPDNYRGKWARMTGYEKSGLHWNQFISVYINKASNVYRNNYLVFMREFMDIDEDEEEEEIPDDTGSGALQRFLSYPVGTIVIKENYLERNGKPDEAVTLTAMVKHAAGYAPDGGDWEYIQLAQDGTILLMGSIKDAGVQSACASCHNNVQERDFVFSTILAE